MVIDKDSDDLTIARFPSPILAKALVAFLEAQVTGLVEVYAEKVGRNGAELVVRRRSSVALTSWPPSSSSGGRTVPLVEVELPVDDG